MNTARHLAVVVALLVISCKPADPAANNANGGASQPAPPTNATAMSSAENTPIAPELPVRRADLLGWIAVGDLMPPGPYRFYVTGKVGAPNATWKALLQKESSDGPVLILRLRVLQVAEIGTPEETMLTARYDESGYEAGRWKTVRVLLSSGESVDLPVTEAH